MGFAGLLEHLLRAFRRSSFRNLQFLARLGNQTFDIIITILGISHRRGKLKLRHLHNKAFKN